MLRGDEWSIVRARLPGQMPRVLFVNSNFEDYLSDGLFHGLRSLLGADAVDLPKVEPLYRSHPAERRESLRGHGMTLYGLLEDLDVDRHRGLYRARHGQFDLVVFADIWRNFGLFTEWMPRLRGHRVAVLDGSDRVEPYPYAGRWWRMPRWWLVPRGHRRATFFKREITPATYWFASYLVLPGALARRLGVLRDMRPLAFSIPEEKILAAPPGKDRLLTSHVVDAEVAAHVGASTTYAFDTEEAYYADLQRSRFGVTTKRAGWDALRHYELAANGCVPCVRDLDRKPPSCAPYGLDETNCVPYLDAAELMARIETMGDDHYRQLQSGALAWARANSTRRRAAEFLDAVGLGASTAGSPERLAVR
jgi:hypothetical protein